MIKLRPRRRCTAWRPIRCPSPSWRDGRPHYEAVWPPTMSHRFSTLRCAYYRSKRRYAPTKMRPRGGEPPSSPRQLLIIIWRTSGLALHPIGGRVGSTSVPSSTQNRKGCRVSRGKKS
ncbi:hypothetical protein TcCL_ESM10535 [Trypanosoma cruzi]|nr:hypothetical protein TcCL_ESM10535 [Trypanosoma cruzi]